jgi:hypothetical protein
MDDLQEIEQVENHILINDLRDSGEFRGSTFSGYKKAEVKKQLLTSLLNSRIEHSCYWSAELVCSGHYMDLWEILLFYLGKYIHLANPKLAIYLQKRFQVFRNIMVQGLYYDELQLRNNATIRNMFIEIVSVLSVSPKKPGMEPIKIKRNEEFDMTKMTERLKAPSTDFGENVLRKEDPKEISIAVNEFAYHISSEHGHIPNMVQACYWVEWIIEFDTICKKNKQSCLGANRDNIPVEFKYQKEVIWIIWDTLFFTVSHDSFLTSLLKSILDLFCLKFTPGCVRKRHYLLYFAISITTEPFIRDVQMIANKGIIEHALSQCDIIYKQIKKNEIAPQTEYLFAGLHDPNAVQKSLQKIELVNSMSFS